MRRVSRIGVAVFLTLVLALSFGLSSAGAQVAPASPAQCIFSYLEEHVVNLRSAPGFNSDLIGETLARGEWIEMDASVEPVPSGSNWDWLPAKWGAGTIWVSGKLVYVSDCPDIDATDEATPETPRATILDDGAFLFGVGCDIGLVEPVDIYVTAFGVGYEDGDGVLLTGAASFECEQLSPLPSGMCFHEMPGEIPNELVTVTYRLEDGYTTMLSVTLQLGESGSIYAPLPESGEIKINNRAAVLSTDCYTGEVEGPITLMHFPAY